MLKVWTSPAALAEDSLLPNCWAEFEGQGSLPRLRDAVASFLFAGTTSNSAVHLSQRQTHRQTERLTHIHSERWHGQSWSHRCHRQGTAFNSPWAAEVGGHWCRHTDSTLQVHKHMHIWGSLGYQQGPFVQLAPLPASWSPSPLTDLLFAGWSLLVISAHMQHSHSAPQSRVPPDTSVNPAPTWCCSPLLLAGSVWGLPANIHARCPEPPQHMASVLGCHSIHQHRARHSCWCPEYLFFVTYTIPTPWLEVKDCYSCQLLRAHSLP